MTKLTVAQQEIQAILVEAIGVEPTPWETIQASVKAEIKVRNWKAVRDVLQFLTEGGFIEAVEGTDAYRVPADPVEPSTPAKPGKKPLDLAQLRAICKELKIPTSKTTPRADLVHAIAKNRGWEGEKPEVIEFLLSGGEIQELPGFTAVAPKPNNRETSAGGKVEPKPAFTKTPRKVSKSGDKPAKVRSENTVTIQEICEELGIEGRIARRKLRGSDIAKPGDSWTWQAGHADIQKVKDLLK